MDGPRSLPADALRVARRSSAYTRMLCTALACLAAAAIAGCTYYQTVPAAPSGPSVFDRAWSAALGAADDTGVSVSTADRTSGTIYGATAADDVTIRVFTQADGSVRVEF